MKFLVLFLILMLSCKEKTFADEIILVTDYNLKMKFQEFNEGLDENSSSLIYRGKLKDSIPLKYFNLYPKPEKIYTAVLAKEKSNDDAKINLKIRFFHDSFPKSERSDAEVIFDSLTNKNLQIVVKYKDTIPHFVIDSTNNLKAYKAYPVFVKNISGEKIKMVVDQYPGVVILNKDNDWQIIRNDSFFVCGDGTWNRKFWILEPGEIIVYAINHFKGSQKARFKIGLTSTFLSEEFEGTIDPKVLIKQREKYLLNK